MTITKERVLEIIQKHIEQNTDGSNNHEEVKVSEITSLKFISIVVDLENEFDFEFDDEYLDNRKFNSLDAIVNYVDEKANIA